MTPRSVSIDSQYQAVDCTTILPKKIQNGQVRRIFVPYGLIDDVVSLILTPNLAFASIRKARKLSYS